MLLRLGFIVALVVTAFAFTGCQNKIDDTSSNGGTQKETINNIEYTTPASTGPSAPPEVKGPSSLPPQVNSGINQAQAVTEKENIQLTLPVKNS